MRRDVVACRSASAVVVIAALAIACGRELAGPGVARDRDRSCFACHGTALPTDTHERVRADIVDSHFDDWRFAEDGTFLTTPTDSLEGYVLGAQISWAPDGMGYVTADGERACSASCHDGHEEPAEIGRQWAASGHADASSEAWVHEFTSGACMQCHSSAGYASYVDPGNAAYPLWGAPSDEMFGHRITCNACHDAQGMPTEDDRRLRQSGLVRLVSGSSASRRVYDAVLDAGSSAACITCHQGRESGGSLFRVMAAAGVDPTDGVDETIVGQSFINPHYRAAGALLFSLRGYEYPGKRYSLGNLFHQGVSCTGCHMSPSDDPRLGGHSFNLRLDHRDHVGACRECHGRVESFDAIGLLRDLDGDGVSGRPETELEGLKQRLFAALGAEGIYYDPSTHPYFYTSPTGREVADRVTTWLESQLTAAFNAALVATEPGAYTHNRVYAAQLLWDSCEAVAGVPLASARPDSSADRPARTYTP